MSHRSPFSTGFVGMLRFPVRACKDQALFHAHTSRHRCRYFSAGGEKANGGGGKAWKSFAGAGLVSVGLVSAGVIVQSGGYKKAAERVEIVTTSVTRACRSFWVLGKVAVDYKRTIFLYKSTDQYKEELSKCHRRSADELLRLCQKQAGVYIKAGQHISSLRPVIPAEFTDTLSCLCDKAPQSTLQDVERVFRDDIGMEMSDVFEDFDPVPVGCASLAQVHKARLKKRSALPEQFPETVAVKVQHSWMSQHTESDLLAVEVVAAVIELLFKGVQVKWILPVFRSNLDTELDFRSECANLKQCAYNFRNDVDIRVPLLVEHLCSKRVLTMEFIEGVKIDDKEKLIQQGIDPTKVAQSVTKLFGEMIFLHGFVHCDPHPGNMLVQKVTNGRTGRNYNLVVLDHGLYREISSESRKTYCTLWEAMVLQDKRKLDEVSMEMGVGKYAKLFPLIFTMRSIDSKVRLGERMSSEERTRVRSELGIPGFTKDDFDLVEVLTFIEKIPRDLLFIIRTQNLVRALCSDLGLRPRERFRIYARLAAEGNVHEHEDLLDSRRLRFSNLLRKWLRGIQFEVHMFFIEVALWCYTMLPRALTIFKYDMDELVPASAKTVYTGV
uniref:ABC1 atypical kinase-like domain-containing protein n=1 Tax=Guillardia theta TaxID=55529 RepID=A0A7S4NHC3_GUITH|mmetsp:Transcript_22160/g.72955  ORF Transcript_22160/g.72955 Transcript_22160/m.72955 type:complete len:610 (+) Transcript_22160:153-1982(+)